MLLNHWLWFRHFSAPTKPSIASSYYGTDFHSSSLPTFTEIASFFFLQIWLVPFALFVSLSASENVLPSMGSEYATDPSSPLGSADARASGAMSMGGFLSPRGSVADGAGAGQQSSRRGLGYDSGRKKSSAKSMVRVAVDGVREWVSESGEVLGLWKGDRTRRW